MMQKMVNFLRGSVRLEVTGMFPERFLNLCGLERLGFWQVEWGENGSLRLTVALWDLSRAREIAQRSGCTLRRLRRQGLPAFLAGFRLRYGLIGGMAAAVLLSCVLSQFVLVVQVTGNSVLSDFVILTELERAGLGFGTYAPAIDQRQIANRVLARLPQLSFLSVNRTGVYVEVVVYEATPVPEVRDESIPTDVVAARDGIITDVNASAGSPSVEAGDGVLAGEVLISHESIFPPAEWSDGVGSSMVSHARGEVWALTERTFSAKTPLTVGVSGANGTVQTRWSLRLGKSLLKFYQNSSNQGGNCDKIRKAWQLTLPGGVQLPVTLVREKLTDRGGASAAVSEDSAEAYLKAQLRTRLEAVLGEGQILEERWQVETAEATMTVTLCASCLEDIAQEQTVADESGSPPFGDEQIDRTENQP